VRYRRSNLSKAIVFTVAMLLPPVAAAQDTPRFGIVMGFPAEVGVVWTLADRVAVRPEVNWTRSSTESISTSTIFTGASLTTTSVTTTTGTTATGYGVSALWYVAKRDALRVYLAPRLAYARAKLTVDRGVPLPNIPVPAPTGTTTSTYTTSGSLGAQYSLARRFAVFAEVGLAYARGTSSLSPASLAGADAKNRSTAIRSGVGAILFFGS
jgi:hypothetical protein